MKKHLGQGAMAADFESLVYATMGVKAAEMHQRKWPWSERPTTRGKNLYRSPATQCKTEEMHPPIFHTQSRITTFFLQANVITLFTIKASAQFGVNRKSQDVFSIEIWSRVEIHEIFRPFPFPIQWHPMCMHHVLSTSSAS